MTEQPIIPEKPCKWVENAHCGNISENPEMFVCLACLASGIAENTKAAFDMTGMGLFPLATGQNVLNNIMSACREINGLNELIDANFHDKLIGMRGIKARNIKLSHDFEIRRPPF